jgi:hypothetical protein
MLRVKWTSFEDSEGGAIPAQAQKEPFFIAVEQQPPIVYLNADFDGLPDLLSDDESRPGYERALRDAEFRRIATAAWSEMFTAAIGDVEVDDEGSVEWPQEDWKRQVLKGLLPDLYPDISDRDEALTTLRTDLNEGTTQVLSLLQVAIARQIGAAKSLRRDIKRVDT